MANKTEGLATRPNTIRPGAPERFQTRCGSAIVAISLGVGLITVLVMGAWWLTARPASRATAPAPTATSLPDTAPAPTATRLLVAVQPANPPSPTATWPARSTPRPSLPPSAEPDTGTSRVAEKDGMTLRYVPAGDFLMGAAGSGPAAESYEKPQHTVYLDAYWLDQTEVTNARFARFVAETGYQTEAEKEGQGVVWKGGQTLWETLRDASWRHPRGPASSVEALADHPVVQVSWDDAQAYCQWAGRRLPTEAEWEKAARGTDGRQYPWGEAPPTGTLANFADRNFPATWADPAVDDGYAFTAPVGAYAAGRSPYGGLDMAGNAWEWVNDWYSEYYYVHTPRRNPLGPPLGYLHVVRGGAWFDVASELSVVNRSSLRLNALGWGDFVSFRCADSPAPLPFEKILRQPPALPAATVSPTDTTAYLSGITPQAREIFRQGQSLGNNPRAFALVGDSNTDNPAFLAPLAAGAYTLGEYAYLEATIAYFRGSFGHHSPAAVGSFNTARALDPAYADARCQPGETPLACEYRLQKPSVALILIGTGDHQLWQGFEGRYRRIITETLALGIVPVLITKADDMEAVFGDAPVGYINGVIERLSGEYQVPLLDLRRVINGLPQHGCVADGFHYSTPPDGSTADFTGDHLHYGFPVRNLTALQVLDVLRRAVLTGGAAGAAD